MSFAAESIGALCALAEILRINKTNARDKYFIVVSYVNNL